MRWPDETACAAHAAHLARQPALLEAIVELHGPLGAGKTTWTRHLLRALGVTGRIKSPTYALLEPYAVGDNEITHFDFYRFADPSEWADAGLRDIFARKGLKLVEWPDKAAGYLPTPDLRLHIDLADPSTGDDQARDVRAEALTPRGRDLLNA